MKLIKKIFDFYINASIHVALAVVAFTYITCLCFKYSLDLKLAVVIFCSTVTGYNFVKYAGIAKLHHRSLTRNLKFIQLFSFFTFIFFLWFLTYCSWRELVVLMIISLLTTAYAIPFLPKKKNLRAVKGLKIFIIALVWTLTTAVLPLIDSTAIDVKQICYFSLHRFILILILLIPFEVRDVDYDNIQLKTLPQLLGVKFSKVLGVFLVLIQLYLVVEFNLDYDLFVLSLISIVFLYTIIASDLVKSFYFASFCVESIPILWYLVIYLIG